MEEKRRMPVSLARVELDGELKGWWFDARESMSGKQFYGGLKAVASIGQPNTLPLEVYEEMYALLARALLGASGKPLGEWNFVDEEGNPLPLDRERIDGLPSNIAWTMLTAYLTKLRELPPA